MSCVYIRPATKQIGLTTNRIADIDQLHIDTGINRRAITVRDVLILVAHSYTSTRVSDDLYSPAKVKSKIESCRSRDWHILAEIEKATCTAHERLKCLRAPEV